MSLKEWSEEHYLKWSKRKNAIRLLFMQPFKNKEVLEKLSTLEAAEDLLDPKKRSERIDYISHMLRDYQKGEERYPDIERDLIKAIFELKNPPKREEIKKIAEIKKRLEKKL